MRKLRNQRALTLAEVLIVVAILTVLSGVAFVFVPRYLRSMTKLEYDNYAKEIFIAAQNHLSLARSEDYLHRDGFGTEETAISGADDTGDGVYYYVVRDSNRAGQFSDAEILNLMLPYASLDETVRLGGSYIVRYHPDAGQILDVFYWSESARRYAHSYTDADYAVFLADRADFEALKTYGADKSVIGYYGGEAALRVPKAELSAPILQVYNTDRLYVELQDTNDGSQYNLKLIVTGETSGAVTTFTLSGADSSPRITFRESDKLYTIVLDDITASDLHFSQVQPDSGAATPFIPGEYIRIQAVAEGKTEGDDAVFAIPRYAVGSGREDGICVNSLFGDDLKDGKPDPAKINTANICNFRHLENLDPSVSRVNAAVSSLQITGAVQTADLDWDDFFQGTASNRVFPLDGDAMPEKEYYPVNPGGTLEKYDGKDGQKHTVHTVSNLRVGSDAAPYNGSAGMFGSLNGGTVQNLRLEDFRINGANAGALAGSADGTAVSNVLAVNSKEKDVPDQSTVQGSGSTGGLIGSAENCTIEKSAAALVVKSTGGDAGGLIGSATGTTISACYSGGHTKEGAYGAEDSSGTFVPYYNVAGDSGAAGGLVGSFAGAGSITGSYSTCSVSGATAGGLAGAADGAISGCYATGLVRGTAAEGAFAGTLSGTATDCSYYEIINERAKDGDASKGYTYLKAAGNQDNDAIRPLDDSTETYQGFVGDPAAWTSAIPYDMLLGMYFQGKFPLQTVQQLSAAPTGFSTEDLVMSHYGDWPAPEIRVINKKA